MKVSILAALESATSRSEQIARQLLALGRIVSREEMVERIEALDLAAIRAAGAQALRSAPTVASIGPVAKVLGPDAVAARVGGQAADQTFGGRRPRGSDGIAATR